MEMALIAVTLVFAGFGLYLAADYAAWRAQGVEVLARIDGFQYGKMIRLPVVVFNKPDGTEIRAKAERVDQLVYFLSRPKEGDAVTVIFREDGGAARVRVKGALPLAGAVIFALPLVAALGLSAGKLMVTAKVAYIAVFSAIMFAGMAVLKFIYRN